MDAGKAILVIKEAILPQNIAQWNNQYNFDNARNGSEKYLHVLTPPSFLVGRRPLVIMNRFLGVSNTIRC